MIHPVILCGGAGTRLWPLSRHNSPKQFVPLIDNDSLFQLACRFAAVPGCAAPLIVTGEDHRFMVREQADLSGQPLAEILIEPEARSTAPAILLAALHLRARYPDALMLVLPSDQLIRTPDRFWKAVAAAVPAARSGKLVTFGIEPTGPDTGFGYIELSSHADRNEYRPQLVRKFVEKPTAEVAAAMVSSGKFLWNAGIFLFTATAIVRAFRDLAPDILSCVEATIGTATTDIGFNRFERSSWLGAPIISIDHAILEKAKDLLVVPCQTEWVDMGDWGRVWAEMSPDQNGNVITGPVSAIDCAGSLVRSEAPGLHVVGFGLENMLVVATADAVLVTPRALSSQVGRAVTRLQADGVVQATMSARELRPWGWFERIAVGQGFQVKRILVKPGASMSLQSHLQRAEHWVVVAGTATVQIGDDVSQLSVNESVYIPIGSRHRLSNMGPEPVQLIEVQTGGYLGEDDIVRYQDQYSRLSTQ